MRLALIGTGLMLALFWFALPSVLFPYAHYGESKADLFPPFLAPRSRGEVPTFADAQKKAKTITGLRRSDPCIDAAYTAGEKDTTAFDKLARFRGFLACYVGQLDRDPRQLCNVDKQQELARYTRGYFYVLAQAREIGTNPALKGRLELPPEIRAHIEPAGITTGYRDFAPDANILHGWKKLVKLGVFANTESLKELLEPEVPADVVEQLGAVQFVRPYCK